MLKSFLKKVLPATLIMCSLVIGCTDEKTNSQSSSIAEPIQKIAVPKFDRDSAFAFIAKQVGFGPRVPNTESHRRCKDWLVQQFRSYGLQVIEQPFKAIAYTGAQLQGNNIVAQYNSTAPRRVLLAAHWDTRHIADSPLNVERSDQPIAGADDGGSGVAVLLEIARQLHHHPLELGVDFVLFDAEDHGKDSDIDPQPESWCLGSQYWSKNIVPAGYNPRFGILLDMVGAKNAKFKKEAISMNFAPELMNRIWQIGQSLGYTSHFLNESTGAVTDDHFFVNTIAKIPMINIIGKANTETGFGEHWHTHQDDLAVIDMRTLRAVGQTLLEFLFREAQGQVVN